MTSEFLLKINSSESLGGLLQSQITLQPITKLRPQYVWTDSAKRMICDGIIFLFGDVTHLFAFMVFYFPIPMWRSSTKKRARSAVIDVLFSRRSHIIICFTNQNSFTHCRLIHIWLTSLAEHTAIHTSAWGYHCKYFSQYATRHSRVSLN